MITRPLARFLLGRPSSVTRFHTSAFLLGARTLQKFKLADIGEGITECEIVKWYAASSGRLFELNSLAVFN